MTQDARNHIQEMLAAFNAATGSNLELTIPRKKALLRLRAKPEHFEAADVTAVAEEIKRLIVKRPKFYDEVSLQFGPLICNEDKFQERAVKLRQRAGAVAAKKARAESRPTPAAPAKVSDAEADRIRARAKEIAAELKAKLSGGSRP